jgi:hypothetical protein
VWNRAYLIQDDHGPHIPYLTLADGPNEVRFRDIRPKVQAAWPGRPARAREVLGHQLRAPPKGITIA